MGKRGWLLWDNRIGFIAIQIGTCGDPLRRIVVPAGKAVPTARKIHMHLSLQAVPGLSDHAFRKGEADSEVHGLPVHVVHLHRTIAVVIGAVWRLDKGAGNRSVRIVQRLPRRGDRRCQGRKPAKGHGSRAERHRKDAQAQARKKQCDPHEKQQHTSHRQSPSGPQKNGGHLRQQIRESNQRKWPPHVHSSSKRFLLSAGDVFFCRPYFVKSGRGSK